jgi:KaiB domain.
MDGRNVGSQGKAALAPDGERQNAIKHGRHEYSLFVSGRSLRSERSVKFVRKVCDKYIGNNYSISVIDVFEDPERAEIEKVFVTPTLIRHQPPPYRRIVGDFSSEEALASSMELGD